ncbi:MAG: hypothetical protein OHK93_001769 [Ramalina farinacea]|uniref:Uncharacterized protein n=1 Tax=Ramalina farinacea TaxID=258253 RepID=A0AA43QUJ4_9LECA|nr:hypothetical protein [Ramalina farinacea]
MLQLQIHLLIQHTGHTLTPLQGRQQIPVRDAELRELAAPQHYPLAGCAGPEPVGQLEGAGPPAGGVLLNKGVDVQAGGGDKARDDLGVEGGGGGGVRANGEEEVDGVDGEGDVNGGPGSAAAGGVWAGGVFLSQGSWALFGLWVVGR